MPVTEYGGEFYSTAFEAMLARKADNLEYVWRRLYENPDTTRRQLAKEMGVDMRTVTRYRAELRRMGWLKEEQ